jgi:ketosteroid isomerase-like protein
VFVGFYRLAAKVLDWEATLRLPDQAPHSMTGFWVVTDTKQKHGSWKISMESYNVKMAPPPTRTQ